MEISELVSYRLWILVSHFIKRMNRVSCPFDPAHVVESRKLQAHLIKCKRNLPTNHDFVQCNFWHLHYVRKSQLDSHHANCPHRLEKEAFKITWESESTKFFEPKRLVNEPAKNCERSASEFLDSWDSTTGPAFKAEKMIAGAIHMTVPQGLSKSKRKEFRDKELERLRERENKKTENVTSGKGNDTKVDNALDFLPPPRRPSVEIPLLRLGRLAAKFPDHLGKDSSEQAHKFCSIKSSNQDADTIFIPSGGRGRGILGPTATAWGNF